MKKKIAGIAAIIFILWAGAAVTDIYRVFRFEMPFFCLPTQTEDDGGSGHYAGLGYSFDIKGNFMPEDEYPGVTKYTAYLFGREIFTGIRD